MEIRTLPFLVVNLDEDCKKQQVGEGWFPAIDNVPTQAITMSVYQIMQSKEIISFRTFRIKSKQKRLKRHWKTPLPTKFLLPY